MSSPTQSCCKLFFLFFPKNKKIKLLKSFRPLPLINMLRPQALKQK
ncbi:hypothetical protein STM474_2858 [Salmonella enterica subsp. enterica serovar Typhimurium str. ST4/74]|uniref:Uncharacterized protein n=1 Tax=Salmonella typhimurium (strain 4/74) TaxID=909946 RepID=E8XJ83_SALT4|nr:hypothetical protein STM474_2858 [Salmonella enterica subsp. enterica serovar Typhimurium str. ST4/74]